LKGDAHTHERNWTEGEEKGEDVKQREESLKKQEEELMMRGEQLEKRKKVCYIISLHAIDSTLCSNAN
jgi:hypothetical protein